MRVALLFALLISCSSSSIKRPIIPHCPLAASDITERRDDLKPYNLASQRLDLTVIACGSRVREKMEAAGGSCAPYTFCCPLSAERGEVNLACQVSIFGTDPKFQVLAPQVRLVSLPNEPFAVKVAEIKNYMIAPGKGKPPKKWEIRAAAPACLVLPSGLCQWEPYSSLKEER